MKVEDFFSRYPLKHYKKGQILVYGGDDPAGVIYLVSGEVRQYDITNSGDEIVVNVFKPSTFFPMSWAMNKTPNDYFFEAGSDVSLRIAPAGEAVKFLKENPDVTFDLLSRVYKGLDGLLSRMKYLMKGSARSRTILELLIESQRFGKKQNGGYLLELSEAEFAARSGLTRETISRELHSLQEKGIVETHYGGVFIKQPKKLEKELRDGF